MCCITISIATRQAIRHVWLGVHCRAWKAQETGGWWNPDWQFRFTLGEHAGVFEAAVPLADLTDTLPEPGTVWGLQAFRSNMGPFAMFSGVYDLVGGEHGTRQFGRMVFQ